MTTRSPGDADDAGAPAGRAATWRVDAGEQPTDEETLQAYVGARLASHEQQVREEIRQPGPKGFFTDTTVCIGCKACEVACKQWNQLPDDGFVFTGTSYDNTGELGSSTWRHVKFVERPGAHPTTGFADISWFEGAEADPPVPLGPDPQPGGDFTWLMMSDVCKHCVHSGCLDVCPTGSIVRTEHDSVLVQEDICNGCGMCIPACPFGVIDRREDDGRAWKCTLCYDRLSDGLEPACAKACPTDSIVFGDIDELREVAEQRVATLHAQGHEEAYLYGADAATQPGTGGLNAFFLLTDEPGAYNLPPDPVDPTLRVGDAWRAAAVAGAGMVAAVVGAIVSAGRR